MDFTSWNVSVVDTIKREATNYGYFLYLAPPSSTSFRTPQEVPYFLSVLMPHFASLILLEIFILYLQGAKVRISDYMNSYSHGILFLIISHILRGVQLIGYQWVYEHRLFDFSWDSYTTWWTAAIMADFGFYLTHRFFHECNFAWAAHQVHHSSEELNLATSIRLPFYKQFFGIGMYYPAALLGVPMPAIIVHIQFNLIFQVWIHTDTISTLGPLEWILNTPSHHRVHHGSNPYCLDKNYGGALIIFDRLFGTFTPERKDEKISFGLVKQPQKFNVFWLQIFYYKYIFKRAASMKTWSDSFKVIFYKPSWGYAPKKEIKPSQNMSKPKEARKKYDPKLSRFMEAYVVGHFVASAVMQQTFIINYDSFSWMTVSLHLIYFFATLSNISAIYDGWANALLLESVRCAASLVWALYFPIFNYSIFNSLFIAYNALSTLLWANHAFKAAANIFNDVNKNK